MRRLRGFSLMEVLIAMVIVGVLAAIAIPSYLSYQQRANQSAAQQFMLDVASRVEQYRLDARDYPDGIGTGTNDIDVTIPDDVSPNYSVTFTSDNTATPPTYTITLAPKSGSVQDGEPTLTLDSAGNKTPAAEW